MRNSICIIDDKIPAVKATAKGFEIDDTKELDSNILKYLLKTDIDWENEQPLKSLITALTENDEEWNVLAYTNPHFFINSLKNSLIRPEVIVFDWEYFNKTADSEKLLSEILEICCAVVYIYSGTEKTDEIKTIIASEKYTKFQNRLDYIDKDNDLGTGTEKILIEKLNILKINNFSFKFGNEIRHKSIEAMENILVELGKINLEEVANYLSSDKKTNSELIEFIGERFKNNLYNLPVPSLEEKYCEKTAEQECDIGQDLWSYRLYYKQLDDLVKCGDIVYSEEDKNRLFLILSGNCDLLRFWSKNNGFITVVPLYQLSVGNPFLKERKMPKKDMNLNSLTSNKSEGTMILPFIRDGKIINDYILFPKETSSFNVLQKSKESGKEGQLPISLTYTHWKAYHRICTLSEPFLSSVINTILDSLSEIGVPDYAVNIKKSIHTRVGKVLGWNIQQ